MGGRMVQVGSPNDIFYQPFSKDIARLVGIDVTLKGVVKSNDRGHAEIIIGNSIFEAITSAPAEQRVVLSIRPEEVTIKLPESESGKTSARNQLLGTITRMVQFGPFIRINVDCGAPLTALITRKSCGELGLTIGTKVMAIVKATAIHVIPDSG